MLGRLIDQMMETHITDAPEDAAHAKRFLKFMGQKVRTYLFIIFMQYLIFFILHTNSCTC